MRLIDADALREKMYHEAFEKDSDMQKWDSGCWIRYKMFENAIDDAPTVEPQQWIPVTEKLPKPNELDGNVTRFYLVQNGYGDMMVASFNKSSVSECTWWEQIYQYGEELSDIVAWMPLPEPWKGETYE